MGEILRAKSNSRACLKAGWITAGFSLSCLAVAFIPFDGAVEGHYVALWVAAAFLASVALFFLLTGLTILATAKITEVLRSPHPS
jgi:hypothetical protein